MSPSERKDDSKSSLLKAAAELFSEKGYQAVSTRELAERAKVNLGCIQYHFGSKAKLFQETVYNLMRSSKEDAGLHALEGEWESPDEAACALCLFIASFMRYLLHRRGPHPTRLMCREMLSSSEETAAMVDDLVECVVKDFVEPFDEALRRVVGKIAPRIRGDELSYAINSVLGQCLFYTTHRPFIERADGKEFRREKDLREAVRAVAQFSLRGLGCGEDFIQRTMKEAEGRE